MSSSTEIWLDNDYWSVYTGILGLSSYRNVTPKIKADFRRQQEKTVERFRKRLERLNGVS